MKILTAEEVATLLCATPDTINRMARGGQIKGFRVGRSWRFKQEEIEAFVDRQADTYEQAKERIHKPQPVVEYVAADGIRALGAHPARKPSNNTVILTAHEGAVEWLNWQGYYGEVKEYVMKDDVTGKVVIESSNRLPPYLACLAARIGIIEMPYSKNLGPEKKYEDLTPNDMDRAGAQLVWYTVHKIETKED